jgi:hypothetical protein
MGPNTLLPHLAALKEAAQLFELEVIDALENGNTDEAVGSVQASTGLGRSLVAEPLLISQTVRLSLNNTGYRSLERLVSACSTRHFETQWHGLLPAAAPSWRTSPPSC